MRKIFMLCAALVATSALNAQEKNDSINRVQLNDVVIKAQSIFPNRKLNENASSHHYVNKKELQKFNYSDPNRVLMGKTGISIVEEEGFGLRPNIIIRGAASYRSSAINLMEDGILAAPAPYIAPAAYYFPTMGRMSGVEILKSSGQILYGPNTVGGSMNLVSTQVPNTFKGQLSTSYGQFDTRKVHAYAGDKIGKFGYLVEYFNNASDGFKKLPNGKSTGYNLNDAMVKLLYDNSQAAIPNKLQFKMQFSGLNDHETYMGVTKADFEADPYQRYLASEQDQMNNHHRQYLLSYEIEPTEKLSLNLDVYHNDFARNWYKINDVVVNGEKVGLSSALKMSNDSDEIKVLKGLYDGENNVIARNNNRKYFSQGIQLNGQYNVGENGTIRFGTRYHNEEEDRFQADDKYVSTMDGLSLASKGAPGSQTNRVSDAKASASYAQYQHDFGKLTLTAGVRYENIKMNRTDYEKTDPTRSAAPKGQKENQTQAWIPGLSILYKATDMLSVFGSVHKGFSPPGIVDGQKPESSWNYELGTRMIKNNFYGELTAYVNNYSNLLGADTNAVGGATGQGDLYNAGEVLIKGIEGALGYNVQSDNPAVNFPLRASYTYIDSSFKKDFSSSVYKDVEEGDELPYIPQNQFTLEAGANVHNFSANLIWRYRGDFRNTVGQGTIPTNSLIPAVNLLDGSVAYQVNRHANVFVAAQNILNKKYLAGLNPAGHRPGMPRFVSVGTNIKF